MLRYYGKDERIHILHSWLKFCPDGIVILTVENGGLAIKPYNPQIHDLNKQLNRKLDSNGRVKVAPDIMKLLGLYNEESLHLYISPDNTALIRKMSNYCDNCGREAETQMVLGRNICQDCLDNLKRSE